MSWKKDKENGNISLSNFSFHHEKDRPQLWNQSVYIFFYNSQTSISLFVPPFKFEKFIDASSASWLQTTSKGRQNTAKASADI